MVKVARFLGLAFVPSATVASSTVILAGVPSSFWMVPTPAPVPTWALDDGLVRATVNVSSPSAKLSGTTLIDRKSTRLNSSHVSISYAVFCLKKKKNELTINVLYDITHMIYP